MNKPYIDEKLDDDTWIRTFNPSTTESEEYVWHRDKHDRHVTVLEGNDWQFQFDNELPKVINIYDELIIPKMVYHRIIPGTTQLRIRIREQK